MPHHEMPINKRKIALTAGFVGYIKISPCTNPFNELQCDTYDYIGGVV